VCHLLGTYQLSDYSAQLLQSRPTGVEDTIDDERIILKLLSFTGLVNPRLSKLEEIILVDLIKI